MNWQRIRTRCGRKLFLLTLAVVGSTTAAPPAWSEDSDSVFESVVVEPIGGPLWRPESRGIAAAGPLQRLAMLQDDDDVLGATAPPEAPTAGAADNSPIEQYGEAPVDRTPQFLRSVTPLLSRGQMQCDCGLTYSIQEQDFPVIVGGNIVRADARRRSIFVPLAVRYGLNKRTQLFVNAPLGWSNTEFATPLFDDDRSSTGIGDVSFGATVLLRQNTCTGRSLVGTLRATAPTGDAINPLVVTTAGTGNGVWRLGGDLLVIKNLDPVILFYGAGYTYSFEEEFSGLDVQLGHQISYNLGLGFAANERVTLSTAFLGSYITETEVDDFSLPNTDQDIMQLRLAATISQCNRLIEPFVAFGLTERSPSAQVGIVCTR